MNFRPVVKAVGVTLCMAAISAPFAQQGQGTPAQAAARLVAIEGDALASTESGLVAVNQGGLDRTAGGIGPCLGQKGSARHQHCQQRKA